MTRLQLYLRILLKWRKLILVNALGVTAVAAAVSFVLPHGYTAMARLLPPPEDDLFGLTATIGGGLGGGLSRLKGGFLGEPTPSDLMAGVLGSRTIMDNVVSGCSIAERYSVRDGSKEAARDLLDDLTSLSTSGEGIVTISVEAKTPMLAAEIANSYVDELDRFLRTSNIGRGRNMRRFIEQRMTEVEYSLALAQESLGVFQSRHSIIEVEQETKVAIDAYAELKSELYRKEAELEMVRGHWSPENPYVVALTRETAAFRDQLRRIETGTGGEGFGVGFAVSFADLPPLAAEFARRYLAYRIQEEAYAMLFQQYEYAKILEARDTPTLTVLDYAVPPERKSSPRRKMIVAIALVFGLAAGVTFVFVLEYLEHTRAARPAEYGNWLALRRQFLHSFRGLSRGRKSKA